MIPPRFFEGPTQIGSPSEHPHVKSHYAGCRVAIFRKGVHILLAVRMGGLC